LRDDKTHNGAPKNRKNHSKKHSACAPWRGACVLVARAPAHSRQRRQRPGKSNSIGWCVRAGAPTQGNTGKSNGNTNGQSMVCAPAGARLHSAPASGRSGR
jgi:hypothetical protein